MRILIPVLEFGKAGGYRVISQLANYWMKMGHEVSIMSPVASIKPYFPTVAKVYWVNKDGRFLDDSQLLTPNSYRFWDRWRALLKGINSVGDSYDIILANHSLTAYPVAFARSNSKKFYYIQAYEPEYGRLNGGLGHKLLSLLAWNSYHLGLSRIVNADLYREYKNIRTDRVVLPGLDLSLFTPKKRQDAGSVVKIGCIGRLEPYKGTKYVLDAYLLLKKTMPFLELHIAFGDAHLSELYPGVYTCQPNGDAELAAYYRSMDIMIAPGTVQLGAVHYPVIESMASGTPVITTGYYPANDNNAWIVPIKDALSIKNQIIAILADSEITYQKTKQAYLDVQEFEWSLVSSKMYNYFNEE